MAKELLFSVTKKDLKISFFSGTGAGGQHRNRHMNCVRLSHPASGAKATGQRHRSLAQNKKDAIHNLAKHPKFQAWIKLEAAKHSDWWRQAQAEIERAVDAMMRNELLIEVWNNEEKRWERVYE